MPQIKYNTICPYCSRRYRSKDRPINMSIELVRCAKCAGRRSYLDPGYAGQAKRERLAKKPRLGKKAQLVNNTKKKGCTDNDRRKKAL